MTRDDAIGCALFPLNLVRAIAATVWWIVVALLTADDDE